MPLFNKRAYVEDSLSSVVQQSFSDYEIIVVDDGSTDDSASIVKAMNLPNLRLISQANSGVSVARNRCLAEASCEFVAFLDADDIWREDHLKHLWELHKAFPEADLMANSFVEVSNVANRTFSSLAVEYRNVTDFFSEAAAGTAWVFTSAAMVRREQCLSVGGFEIGESRGEDIDLWIRMGLQFPVAMSDYVGSIYRRVGNSLTTSLSVQEPDVAMRRIVAILDRNDGVEAGRRRSLKELYNRIAIANAADCLARGQNSAARRFLALALGTEILRRRWLLLRVLCLMPASAIAGLTRIRNWAKNFMER